MEAAGVLRKERAQGVQAACLGFWLVSKGDERVERETSFELEHRKTVRLHRIENL